MTIRPFAGSDRARMLAIFDANTPAFFAVNERTDFIAYLDRHAGLYAVCVRDGPEGAEAEGAGTVVAGFAVAPGTPGRAHLNWILVDPAAQGGGIGTAMMTAARDRAAKLGAAIVDIAASQHSAPFFARHGAHILSRIEDGWGSGMHRVDMELPLDA
ncbi:GNAT family N-acetyltransferase [Sphingomonas sp. ERG5]|uniref:GNAT family N-acetyltransferase n=1 Tax=Sphingomonas sp. ERG5 TaxID=1381597 RepID=UPI0006906CC9|nr:GNAT family N-acetyltransferase [Sphingomonas sp. ERG5]